jgi:GNAT superfamily N-acetyltransferase
MTMELKRRRYQGEDDYWRLRAFLREVFLLNDCREFSWQGARLDYWRYFGNEHLEHYALTEAITLWETDDGSIAAFVTPESRGQAYLQVHPAFRMSELEVEMLEAAETYLAEPDAVGKRQLTVWAHQTDTLRQKVLRERGYTRGAWAEHQFSRCLVADIPAIQPAHGYTIRSLGDAAEIPARSWLSWRVFHPDESAENYPGWAWYHDVQRCPLYRRDLDLVAVAPNGDLAAFCTVWYDDVTRTGYFEPVGTAPEHQRKGLGKAVMTEGLRCLKHMGATYATVSGYSQPALALYSSVMSPDYLLFERWQKSFPAKQENNPS